MAIAWGSHLFIDYSYIEVKYIPNEIQESTEEITFKCGICNKSRLTSDLKGQRTRNDDGQLDLLCTLCWPKNNNVLQHETQEYLSHIQRQLKKLTIFPYSVAYNDKKQETIQECLKLLSTLK